jgi:hypothetical protein
MRAFWLLVAAAAGGVLVWQGRPWLESVGVSTDGSVVPGDITTAVDGKTVDLSATLKAGA